MPLRKKARRGRLARRTKSHRRAASRKRASSRSRSRNRRGAMRKSGSRRKRLSVSSIQLPMNGPESMSDVKFNSYIKKVLQRRKPGMKINTASARCIDSILKDTLHQIGQNASEKMGKRKTLKPKIILRAMKKVLPKNMVAKVDAHAQKVLERYSGKKPRR